jgi:hypothetical protein
MRARRVSELLALPVRSHGIQLARPVDVLLDATSDRAVGLEVLCRDGARRFLPLPAADVRADEIAVESALILLDERNLDFYRERTRRLCDAGFADPIVGDDGIVYEALTAA